MTKRMRKTAWITLFILTFFIFILWLIPTLYEDEIADAVRDKINTSLTAKLDYKEIDFSLLRNFPNAQLRLKNVSIVNDKPFEGDTLARLGTIDFRLSIWEIFKSADKARSISYISLSDGYFHLKTKADGSVNYLILKEDTDKTDVNSTSEPSSLNLDLKQYELQKISFSYWDEVTGWKVVIDSFDHHGKGNFEKEVLDLSTYSEGVLRLLKGNESYINGIPFKWDAVLGIDLTKQRYTFRDNELIINKLPINFTGTIDLLESGQNYALNFRSPTSEFKDFFTLLPPKFIPDLEKVQAQGNFELSGAINGQYTDDRLPSFELNTSIHQGKFKYQSLSKTIDNIDVDLILKNDSGLLEHTSLEIKEFRFTLLNDRFEAKAQMDELFGNTKVKGAIKGTLRLENLIQAYPLSSLNEIKGEIMSDFQTSFDRKAIDDQDYSRITLSGYLKASKVQLPKAYDEQSLMLNRLFLELNSKSVNIKELRGSLGKTDFDGFGQLDNLIGYLWKDDPLSAKIKFHADEFSVSDFKSSPPKEEKELESKNTSETLRFPKNLDLVLDGQIKTLDYDGLILQNILAKARLKDGALNIDELKAQLFDGSILVKGQVNTSPSIPIFGLGLSFSEINIAKGLSGLNLFQNLIPVSNLLDGRMNFDLDLNGSFDDDLSADLSTLSGAAQLELLSAFFSSEKSEVTKELAKQFGLSDSKKWDLTGVRTNLKFDQGKVTVTPFKMNPLGIPVTLGGWHGFDKTMGYNATLEIPASYLGTDVQKLLTQLGEDPKSFKIPIQTTISGTFSNPSIKTDLDGASKQLIQDLSARQKDKLLDQGLKTLEKSLSKPGDSTSTKQTDPIKKAADDLLKGIFGGKKKKKDSIPN